MKKKKISLKTTDCDNINRKPSLENVSAIVANEKGEIFDLEGYLAVGRDGPSFKTLNVSNTIEMPPASDLLFLPDRRPCLYNLKNHQLEILYENPYKPGEIILPVAVFNSPGHLITHTCSYKETSKTALLPLFSYGAVGWHRDTFRSAAILVDSEPRQDLSKMPQSKVIAGIRKIKKILPENSVRYQLEKCALTYGCPAGKNFFLGRYEAPLPTSRRCNSRCLGCISLQADCSIRSSQDRIQFTPSSLEISDLALLHINRVKHAIVSFGQGCEGEPLLASDTIIDAVKMIRDATSKGTINMNTNGSLPSQLEKLFDAGLDSVRVSINSFRESCYNAYFRPTNYCFNDVMAGINLAISKKKHISINYLSLAGFTNSLAEVSSLNDFLKKQPINMIQWRNLNFDPLGYITSMNKVSLNNLTVGVSKMVDKIRDNFPNVKHGYFNPSKDFFRKNKNI